MNFGKNALEFSKEQIVETEKDMKNLHITDADVKTKASEYINKIIEFVQKLIDNGHAYATDKGDVYFSVKTFPEYGKLSHRKVDEMLMVFVLSLKKEKKTQLILLYGSLQNREKFIGIHLGEMEDQVGT